MNAAAKRETPLSEKSGWVDLGHGLRADLGPAKRFAALPPEAAAADDPGVSAWFRESCVVLEEG